MTTLLRNIFTFLLITAMVLPLTATAKNSDNTTEELSPATNPEELLQTIVDNYRSWNTVELSGKFSSDKLPVSPSVKIYMEKAKVLRISLRVPLLGEIGRVEVANDTILLLNRHNKTYVKECMGDFIHAMPAGLEDLQAMLLGRIFILNYGELSMLNGYTAEIYRQEDSLLVLPKEQPLDGLVKYGFATTLEGILYTMQAITDDESKSLGIDYTFSGEKMNMKLSWKDAKHNLQASFKLDAPSWEAYEMAPAKITSKMKRVGIKDFVKSF